MKIPAATEEGPIEPEPNPSNASHHTGGSRRRSHHGHTSTTGRRIVLLMTFLVLLSAGVRTYLAITGTVHPFFVNMSHVTRLVINGLFTAVLLLCLFRLYRGSPAIRQLFGWAGAILALALAVMLTWGVMEGALPPLWIGLDLFALVISAFAAWVCFFSSTAHRFFSHQNHKS